MYKIKIFSILLLFVIICFPLNAAKRAKPKDMKELTDPNSHSYVPYPYPKTRKEIIADLQYYVEKYCDKEDSIVYIGNTPPLSEIILSKLFAPQSKYQIDEIIKVENCIDKFPEDYTWLIFVIDDKGNNPLRIVLMASGLFFKCGAIGEEHLNSPDPFTRQKMARLNKILKDDDIKRFLSESFGRYIEENEIKKLDRVSYASTLGELLHPIWKIKMSNGQLYFYSEVEDMVYAIDKKIPWKKYENGARPDRLSLVQHWDFLPDYIADELIVLKKMPRK